MIKVRFFVHDLRHRAQSYLATMGRVPSEMHYGLEVLRQQPDLKVEPVFINRGSSNRAAYLARLLYWRLAPPAKVFWAYSSRKLAHQITRNQHEWDVAISADNVATATLLALRHRERLHKPVICMLIGVADWLERVPEDERKQTIEYLGAADRILVLGHAEVDYLRQCGLRHTFHLPFGVDTGFWKPADEPLDDFVLAAGSDPQRDYDTLIKACPYPLKIVTSSPKLVTVPLPDHVAVMNTWYADLYRLIARARVTVVPLKDVLQPSGQHVIMQVMAMGKALILTQTRGVWTDVLRDSYNCLFVRPYDVEDLRQALDKAYDSEFATALGCHATETALAHFDTSNLVDGWARAVHEVMCSGNV